MRLDFAAMTRRQWMGLAASSIGDAVLAPRSLAAQPSAELDARISRVIREYERQGFHRTGTDADRRSGDWLYQEVRRIGLEPAREPFDLDHATNWTFVGPMFQQRFTVYAIARRGRGATTATRNHTLEQEAQDVADLVRSIGAPVYLLGHSYGAHCALLAAAHEPARVAKLVLYEPPRPQIMRPDALAALQTLAAADAWDQLAFAFFANTLHVPVAELEALRESELWLPIVADAPATLADLRALVAYRFDPQRFAGLNNPVMLQVGSESPRDLYVTDDLAAVLRDVRVDTLTGQAHEGMTTAPQLYADATMRFLMSPAAEAVA
jgi:pimeloyl-ACP methyl ester carboxylesterase